MFPTGPVRVAVVVLKDRASVEKAPGSRTQTCATSVSESMARDLLHHQLSTIVHLGPRCHRVDPESGARRAEVLESLSQEVIAVPLLGVLGAKITADHGEIRTRHVH